MLRVFTSAALLLAVTAATVQAQIVSNPVVTSWPTGTALTTYPMSPPPVSADVCTPPVVTFYSPYAAPPAPITTFMAPSTMAVPVTAFRWPARTVRQPVTIVTVPASVTRVYRPVWQTAVLPVPVTTMYAPAAVASPVTSYHALSSSPVWNAPTSTSLMTTAPASSGSGCNCQGR